MRFKLSDNKFNLLRSLIGCDRLQDGTFIIIILIATSSVKVNVTGACIVALVTGVLNAETGLAAVEEATLGQAALVVRLFQLHFL